MLPTFGISILESQSYQKKVHIKIIISLIITYNTFIELLRYVPDLPHFICLFIYLFFRTLVILLYKSPISSPHFSSIYDRPTKITCFVQVQSSSSTENKVRNVAQRNF